MNWMRLDSPVGALLLVSDGRALREIRFDGEERPARPEAGWQEGGALLERAARQLAQYFAGERRAFDLPLAAGGTDFQRAVWRALERIPYGTTISYGELARRVGNPRASRAVGAANGRNPLPIVVPCHRVIGGDGRLTGFGGGLPIKEALLALEAQGCGLFRTEGGARRPAG